MDPQTEALYRCLKQVQGAAQSLMFSLPAPGSEAYKAMGIDSHEMWKMGALVDCLVWLQKKSGDAETSEWMRGKE